MIAKELISETIPNLLTSDTADKALNWMEIFKISHLPIVNNKELLGIISEADILDLNEPNEAIGNHNISLTNIFVYENEHIYNIINIFSDNKLTVLPVVNANNEYIGAILLQDLFFALKEIISIDDIGGIIVLQFVNFNDISLTEIANIVEQEGFRILSVYTRHLLKDNKIELVLKINSQDITAVIKSLERFNYNIKATYSLINKDDDLLDDRYNELLYFLNI